MNIHCYCINLLSLTFSLYDSLFLILPFCWEQTFFAFFHDEINHDVTTRQVDDMVMTLVVGKDDVFMDKLLNHDLSCDDVNSVFSGEYVSANEFVY